MRNIKLQYRTIFCCAVLGAATMMTDTGWAQSRKIYIAPDDHTDYFWSATAEVYHPAFIETLDRYLANITATAGDPIPYQARWNTDGTIWLWEYEHDRAKTAADFDALMARVADKHITVPLNTLVSTYGGAPFEAVIRDMMYAGRLERRYNVRLPLVLTMENATVPFGLGAIFRGAGARWTWHGVCACTSPAVPDAGDREYDAYYWKGSDGSKLLMKWQSFQPLLPGAMVQNQGFGGYAEARFPAAAIDQTSTDGFKAKYPYSTIGIFGQGWDDVETAVPLGDLRSFPTIAREKTTADTQVIVSNEQDYFSDFERQFGATLPSLSVSFGNEWDLGAAALAEKSATVKRELEKLRAAESMATLASLTDANFIKGRETARDRAFHSVGQYYEHNWGGGPGATDAERLAWQTQLVANITKYVEKLYSDAAVALGSRIPADGSATRYFVFNPLSFARTDIADLRVPGTDAVHVVDLATGADVPSERIGSGSTRIIRILASGVASVGYKVYEVRPGVGTAFPPVATIAGGTVTTPEFTAAINTRGALTSLKYAGGGNAELAATIAGRAINDLGGAGGTLTVERNGPVSASVRVDVTDSPRHTARYTFYKAMGRIDIRNDINENFYDVRTWGFSFNLPAPLVRHEEIGVIGKARLAPDGIYSPRVANTRYDWLTMNHFADMTRGDGQLGVTISNADTSFMSLGTSSIHSLDTTTPQINVLAGGVIGIGPYGQGGDTHFLQRFSLHPHRTYNETTSMRFALAHQNPLVAGKATGSAAAAFPALAASFLTVGAPNVFLWSLKPAEDGIETGAIARFWNTGAGTVAVNATLGGPFAIASAKATTHIETDTGPAAVNAGRLEAPLPGRRIATFRLAVTRP